LARAIATSSRDGRVGDGGASGVVSCCGFDDSGCCYGGAANRLRLGVTGGTTLPRYPVVGDTPKTPIGCCERSLSLHGLR